MASTKYRLLCKYSNQALQTLVYNSDNDEYIKTEEFYTKDHKLSCGTSDEKKAAETEKMQMILSGNDAQNPKASMLFAFDGTKRVSHSIWMPKQKGYVVRDYSAIRDKISPAGDYTGDFIILDGDTPEEGTVVSKTNLMTETVNLFSSYFNMKAKDPETVSFDGVTAVTEDWLLGQVNNSTVMKLKSQNIHDYVSNRNDTFVPYPGNITYYRYNEINSFIIGEELKNLMVHYNNQKYYGSSSYASYYTGYATTTPKIYGNVSVTPAQVETIDIPAHYEEVIDSPYMVKDVYRHIEGEPWFSYGSSASLDNILKKAKLLIEAIGKDNVILLKEVTFAPSLKIK